MSEQVVTPSITDRLEPVFQPNSIAVIGASQDPNSTGYRFVRDLVDFGFEPVYPVNPNASEIYELNCYPSVLDISDTVDLAIIILHPEIVTEALRECGEKGVEAAHIMSSGFSETGTEEGKRLEAEVQEIADKYSISVIGPNCRGLYNPAANLTHYSNPPADPGSVGVVSHSGGLTIDIANQGKATGIRFSKIASIGNATDIDITDVLEYFAVDNDTEVIAMYVEGIDDQTKGKRLFKLLREVTPEKPVVVLKGGKTERGGEAAESHTGALAGNNRVWQAVFEQTGVTEVDSLHEMMDILRLYSTTTSVESNQTALIGPGGGTSVITLDMCAAANIEAPKFGAETIASLKQLDLASAGNLTNPVDVPFNALSLDEGRLFESIAEIAVNDESVDSVIIHLNFSHLTYSFEENEEKEIFETMMDGVKEINSSISVPLLMVFRNSSLPEIQELAIKSRSKCIDAGIPVFDSMADAVTALNHLVDYSLDRSS
jgi:acyl-CoA synthetase (NDP forming)